MKRAVVIGGCGFIGSHVTKELKQAGYDILVIDNLSTGTKDTIDPSIPLVEIDIRNFEELAAQLQEGDLIFHLAALTSVPGSIENPLLYNEVNIRGTYNVFEAAKQKKAMGIVFSSSAAVYGNQEGMVDEAMTASPLSPYGLQKLIGEEIASMYSTLFSLPVISLRYFNVYGKGNHEEGSYAPVTARLLKAKREGKPLPIVGTGLQTRDFIHVEDVARANVLAATLLESKKSGVFNICSGIPTSVISIAEMIGGEKEYLPPRQEIMHSSGNPKRAQEMLGFSANVELSKGISQLLQS